MRRPGVLFLLLSGLASVLAVSGARAAQSGCGWSLASASAAGAPGDNHTFEGHTSGNGRHVIFDTESSNIVKGTDSRFSNVYLRDRSTGAVTMPALGPNGAKPNWHTFAGPMSPDGRYFAFSSVAMNFGVPNNGQEEVYLRDTVRKKTTLVSIGLGGKPANMAAGAEALSPDGRYVLFNTPATNMPGGPAGSRHDSWGQIFVRDLINKTTTLVSVGYDGRAATFGAAGGGMSRDGRWIVFSTGASNIVRGDSNENGDVFMRDMRERKTIRISLTSTGKQIPKGSKTQWARMTPDGRYTIFTTAAALVSDDTNKERDVYVYETATRRIIRASLGGGKMAYQSTGAIGWSISDDGRVVTFSAHNLDMKAPHEINAYARDWRAGKTKLISVCDDGTYSNNVWNNEEPVRISGDGKTIVLISSAMNFDPRATSGHDQLYVRPFSLLGAAALASPGPYRATSGTPFEMSATITDAGSQRVISGGRVRFDLLDSTGKTVLDGVDATTEGDGRAAATMLMNRPAGRYIVRSRFAGDSLHAAGEIRDRLDLQDAA